MTAPGARIGPYEIREVYRARDTRLERTVAIKVMSALMAGTRESRGGAFTRAGGDASPTAGDVELNGATNSSFTASSVLQQVVELPNPPAMSLTLSRRRARSSS